MLYGIDLARRDMARSSQAVVVEGYTDVMACHLAGVPTAVATCGTAFGDEHARVLRRFLHDHEEFRGEVIFTFDGDAAGQKAAIRAFGGDQNFVSQTYVAVEPNGLDPCDLRLQGRRRRCASWSRGGCRCTASCSATWSPSTTSTAPTAGSTRSARRAKLVASIRDQSKVDAFAREIAGMVGVDIDTTRCATRCGGPRRAPARATTVGAAVARPAAASAPLPDLRDPRFALERETLKLVLQHPGAVGPDRRRRRRQRLHPPDLSRGLGARDRGGWPVRTPTPAGPAAARATSDDPVVAVGGQRPRRRAAAHRQGTGRGVRGRRTSTGSRSSRPCGGSPR